MTSSPVYDWDNNCQRIHDRIYLYLSHIKRELGELESEAPDDMRNLLYYFKKWHYNNELFNRTMEEVATRKNVIEMLNRKGYGVSTALAGDMGTIQQLEGQDCLPRLIHTFNRALESVKSRIYMPPEQIANRNSSYIIRELCKRLGENHEEHIFSTTPRPPGLPPGVQHIPINVLRQIQQDTPPHAHLSILNRMFLELTEESSTIMEGTIGEVNVDTPQHLKFLASRNLRELFSYLYDTIDEELSIDLEWIKRIHYSLTRDLDTSHTWRAGEFRKEDFEDRSGLTLEFGNFERGLDELGAMLGRVNWKTENLRTFTTNLAKFYYMLLGIHPFTDSNGRTAKCLINHLMLRRGLPPLLFDVHEEILYLPRYGGSTLMMEHYFLNRMTISIERYLFERDKKCHFGNLEKHFFKVDFDAGFYFRHVNGMFPLIEVDFNAYIIPDGNPHCGQYMNQCKIVLPDENLLNRLIIHYGFTREGQYEWEEKGELSPSIFWKRGPDSRNIPFFNLTCFIQLGPHLAKYDNLEISVACPALGRVFNNKSLNYKYQMDRPHLTRILGDSLTKRIMSNDAYHNDELSPIRRLRDHLEHRSWELIKSFESDEGKDMEKIRSAISQRHPDVAESYRCSFIPSLFQFIKRHDLTGRGDPADPDNMQLLHYCAHRITPNSEKIFGYL